jgi:hypothetical protein
LLQSPNAAGQAADAAATLDILQAVDRALSCWGNGTPEDISDRYFGDDAMLPTDEMTSVVPSAKDVMQKIALAESEKASEEVRKRAREEAEKKALIERLSKPSGLSDEEVMKKAAAIIERAAKNGLTEVEVYRFPNALCNDHGRAINQQEPGWEATLTGIPKEIYEFWYRRLRPLGYKLRVQIVDFSGGVPGDVGMTLKWG